MGDERVLDDGECPLAISLQHARHREKGMYVVHEYVCVCVCVFCSVGVLLCAKVQKHFV